MAVYFLGSSFYGHNYGSECDMYGCLMVADSEESYLGIKSSLIGMVTLPDLYDKLGYEECQGLIENIDFALENCGLTEGEFDLLCQINDLLSNIPEEGFFQSIVE